MKCRQALVLLLSILFFATLNAQKKIVILGSSSAAGAGATKYDSSWAGRLQNQYQKNMTDGKDTVVQNLAQFGYVTYHILPNGYVPPANRAYIKVDTERNVTKAISLAPDVVIINLPSNDVVNLMDYDPKETMDNLRLVYKMLTDAGIRTFITSTQPRNDIDPNTHFYQREQLRNLRDSIQNNFRYFSINFYDPLVSTDGLLSLREDVRDPVSQYHINDRGHRLVYQQVSAKDIFVAQAPLPVSLLHFEASEKEGRVTLGWKTTGEEGTTTFEVLRGSDGVQFEPLHTQKGTGNGNASYSWTDQSPLQGQNFYRLKIREGNGVQYSKVLSVQSKGNGIRVRSLFLANGQTLTAEVSLPKSSRATVTVISAAGAVVRRQDLLLDAANNKLSLPLPELAPGIYYLNITTADGLKAVQSFIKK